jgi:hypothetical protein
MLGRGCRANSWGSGNPSRDTNMAATSFSRTALVLASLACACTRPGTTPALVGPRDAGAALPVFEGSVAQDKLLAALRAPQNPHMAANGRSAMHVDAASSNTNDSPGPHGFRQRVQSRAFGLVGGECSTINFDRRGRVVAMCVRLSRPALVHKLSTVTGLVYLYTKRPHPRDGVEAFYLTAIDFESGETVFRILAGTGVRFDNNWAELALGPDGSAYVGVLNGLVRIADGRALRP